MGGAVAERDPQAIVAFDALALRASRPCVGNVPRATRFLGALDRALYADGPEIVDDPSFSCVDRTYVIDRLDRLNDVLGSYDSFVSLTLPLIERAAENRAAPVVVHDLAAGHGGFALALKERLGDAVEVVASDIRDEYIELGREQARARRLTVSFEVADAFALVGSKAAMADVFTCTQSLHHFTPGMIARMFGEAARAAASGVVFIDGERSWTSMAIMAPFAAVYGRTYAFLHDTIVSLRRMYYEEELALLSAIAPQLPPRMRIETGTIPPAHVFVRAMRESNV